jgi:hypothetical protein
MHKILRLLIASTINNAQICPHLYIAAPFSVAARTGLFGAGMSWKVLNAYLCGLIGMIY